MSDLKPCPFCGERVYLDYDYAELSFPQEIVTMVVCKECGAMSKTSHAGNMGADQYWNTRPIEDALRAEVARLTAEIDAAKARIAELEAQIRQPYPSVPKEYENPPSNTIYVSKGPAPEQRLEQ